MPMLCRVMVGKKCFGASLWRCLAWQMTTRRRILLVPEAAFFLILSSVIASGSISQNCLATPPQKPELQSQEQAWLITEATGPHSQRVLTLGQTGGKVEFSRDTNLVSKAPEWKAVFYNTAKKKFYEFPFVQLSNSRQLWSETTNKAYTKIDRGFWHGLKLWQAIVHVNENDIPNSMTTIMVPTKDSGLRTIRYDLYYTDSLKITPNVTAFTKVYFREVTPIDVPGLPLALIRHQNDNRSIIVFMTTSVKSILVDRDSAFKYPVGMKRSETLDGVDYDQRQLDQMSEVFEDLGIGQDFVPKKEVNLRAGH